MSTVGWLTEMGMEDPAFIHHCEMNSQLDEFSSQQLATAFGNDFNPWNDTTTTTITPPPQEKLKASDSTNSCTTGNISSPEPSSSSPKFISFGSSNSNYQQFCGSSYKPVLPGFKKLAASDVKNAHENQNYASKAGQGNKKASAPYSRPAYGEDHVIAERKRREKLSQRFIALSAIVPGLTKMDKASVLECTTKYLKQLQDRVKKLEDQTSKKTMESVVFVKKIQIPSSDKDSSSTVENPLPEIEAKVTDRNVLIRIHCEKQKGVLVKTLAETEKLNLSVISSSVIPFGNSTLDITVMAQMDEDFNLTSKDLVTTLRSAFLE